MHCWASLVAQTGKNLPAMQETPGDHSPGEENGNSLQYSCPGQFHGQKNLVGVTRQCPFASDLFPCTVVAGGFPGEYSCPTSVTQTFSGRAHPPCTYPRRPQARALRSPPRRRSPRSLLWRGPSAPAPPEPFPSHSFLLRVPFLSPPCHPASLLPSFPRALPSLSESRRLRLFQSDPPSRPPRSTPPILCCSRPPGSSPEETPLPSSIFLSWSLPWSCAAAPHPS